jgi:hypothetical protein
MYINVKLLTVLNLDTSSNDKYENISLRAMSGNENNDFNTILIKKTAKVKNNNIPYHQYFLVCYYFFLLFVYFREFSSRLAFIEEWCRLVGTPSNNKLSSAANFAAVSSWRTMVMDL